MFVVVALAFEWNYVPCGRFLCCSCVLVVGLALSVAVFFVVLFVGGQRPAFS